MKYLHEMEYGNDDTKMVMEMIMAKMKKIGLDVCTIVDANYISY